MKTFFAFFACCLLSFSAGADEAWRIESDGPAWSVEGTIIGPDDVSGAAGLSAGRGMLVSDESRVAQPFAVDAAQKKIVVGRPVTLLAGEGKELDLEGIAASPVGGCYYATGSHGVARKSGKVQADRSHVFRVPVDASTGAIKAAAIAVTTLGPVIQSDPVLRDALGKSSELHGLDIEGLAEKGGVLFFGLRSPNIEGEAFVIEVKADELFTKVETAAHLTHRLALGAGLGIRDMVRVSDGFLLIAGPAQSDEAAHGFTLQHWTGLDRKLTKIGEVPPPDSGKAEGLLVLGESPTAVEVLIFFDGAKNGAPVPLKLIKPHRP
jgi:hypothetical protein